MLTWLVSNIMCIEEYKCSDKVKDDNDNSKPPDCGAQRMKVLHYIGALPISYSVCSIGVSG